MKTLSSGLEHENKGLAAAGKTFGQPISLQPGPTESNRLCHELRIERVISSALASGTRLRPIVVCMR